jgi:RNA polymerase sigma-B factor
MDRTRVDTALPARRWAPEGASLSAGSTQSRTDDQSSEVERLLGEYLRTRDIRVRDRIVLLHERLVRYLAGRFPCGPGISHEDLVQVGYVGLVGAVERFRADRGARFITYATPTIVGCIQHYLRDCAWGCRIPRRLRELGARVQKSRIALEATFGRPPSTAELAEATAVTEAEVLRALEVEKLYWPASLDAEVEGRNGHSTSYEEAVGEEDPALLAVELGETVRQALDSLERNERFILHCRFYQNATQADVANRLGISQMQVSRMERRALQRLKGLLS